MASLEGWDLDRYRRHLRQRASQLRADPRVLVRFDESDLVQETLLRALDAPEGPAPEVREQGRLAWLEQIQDNLLIDKHREHFAQKRDVRREQGLQSLRQALQESTIDHVQMAIDSSLAPERKAQDRELERLTEEAIDRLPALQREVVRLRQQGLTLEAIADRLGLSRGAAAGHYRRGLDRLKRLLGGGQDRE